MKNKIAILLFLFIALFTSCEKEESNNEAEQKEGTGTIWLSGGLYFCAEQIHLDSGDTLIVVNNSEIIQFQSGDHVLLKYRETGDKASGCNIGIDCEVLEVKKTD